MSHQHLQHVNHDEPKQRKWTRHSCIWGWWRSTATPRFTDCSINNSLPTTHRHHPTTASLQPLLAYNTQAPPNNCITTTTTCLQHAGTTQPLHHYNHYLPTTHRHHPTTASLQPLLAYNTQTPPNHCIHIHTWYTITTTSTDSNYWHSRWPKKWGQCIESLSTK